MSHTPETDTHERGERWYDPHKVTIALCSLLTVAFGWWGSQVSASTRASELKNVTQDEKIQALEAQVLEMRRGNERFEAKLDRALERLPK